MNKTLGQILLPAVIFFVFCSSPVSGEILFSGLDLSSGNQLLFRAGSGRGSRAVQDALFLSRLAGTPAGVPAAVSGHLRATGQHAPDSAGVSGLIPAFPVQQLTAFPEKMDLLENGRVLQIRNAFGAVRVSLSGGLPMPIPGLPSFAGGSAEASGRAEEMAPSADGRWLLYLEPVSAALGNLIMVDVFSGAKTQIASRLERPERQFPASWSPDSRLFIYEQEGKLFYYMPGTSLMPDNEKVRLIGDGTINSISWSRGADFYYLKGSTLHHVRGAELFTRALYANFLEVGVVAGKLPFEFDPYFDNFWIAPDGSSLLVSKGRRSLFYYPLRVDSATSLPVLPYFLLPRSCSEINVLWPAGGTVTILVFIPGRTGTEVKAWRLGRGSAFEPLPLPGTGAGSFSTGSLSPGGELALLWGEGGILLYDYAEWKLLEVLGVRPAVSCLWAGIDEIITGDDQKIERLRLTLAPRASVNRREMVCLSRAQQAGFEEKSPGGEARPQGASAAGSRILAKSADAWYVTDGRNPWTAIANPQLRSPSQVSGQYRVYLENQGMGLYANLPMIRNITSVGTFPLFPPPARSVVSRTGQREVALCFDLYDDDQGLPETLDALNRFGVKATFFLNGEFIRRYPEAVLAISAAGHECASMFFAPMDLSDMRFRTDYNFIARGLARNEDEFYRITGKELALLWHPPYYLVSPEIAAAAARAGYSTSGRDLDPLDWVSREEEKRLGLLQRSPSQMVDNIMAAVKPGIIIPVRLGLLSGGRNDYLFNRINVLLEALIREGYTLTTVSVLMVRAQGK